MLLAMAMVTSAIELLKQAPTMAEEVDKWLDSIALITEAYTNYETNLTDVLTRVRTTVLPEEYAKIKTWLIDVATPEQVAALAATGDLTRFGEVIGGMSGITEDAIAAAKAAIDGDTSLQSSMLVLSSAAAVGFAQGLERHNIEFDVRQFFYRAQDAGAVALEARSPSKVWARLGDSAAQGFSRGLENYNIEFDVRQFLQRAQGPVGAGASVPITSRKARRTNTGSEHWLAGSIPSRSNLAKTRSSTGFWGVWTAMFS